VVPVEVDGKCSNPEKSEKIWELEKNVILVLDACE